MADESYITRIIDFIVELFNSFKSGYLFFGSTADLIKYAIDIILVTFLFYWILLFIRQSRAWQLIKGIVLILLFVIVCGLFQLDMVGFIFSKLLYVLAFAFVVIFQPELRRALETVGLKSFGSLKNILKTGDVDDNVQAVSFVHQITLACKEMASTYTGALILIERTTKLDELLTQENVVKFDSTVTNSVIQSIFYKGSPMHDGGLLIRDGRIIAARCHVPLSVTMHNLERSGTRHRAAVGASEMGDTIAVAVSEERGKVSIAVNGRLYEMNDSNELEANLSYLLGLSGKEVKSNGFAKFLAKFSSKKGSKKNNKNTNSTDDKKTVTVTESSGEFSADMNIKTKSANEEGRFGRATIGAKIGLIILSFALSLGLWMYMQVNNNPVVTKSFVVPISLDNAPSDVEISYPIKQVQVEVKGRQSTINSLTSSDIKAELDYSNSSSWQSGVVVVDVTVSPADKNTYFRVEQQVPENISVTVY